MKKFYFISLLALATLSASAQDKNERNLSKYAVNTFSDHNVYCPDEANRYDIVSVTQPKGKKVKNVILMIGDGMGLDPLTAAWVANKGKLNVDNCQYTGIIRTYSANRLITDSAAAGSAIATGRKTNNYAISIAPDGEQRPSILAEAQEKGMKTGLAVTCRIEDATPSVFVAHNENRKEAESIAEQYSNSGVDFLFGGGTRYFNKRSDGRDLFKEMADKGYNVADSTVAVSEAKLPYISLRADLELAPALDRGRLFEDACAKAIELLDNKKGFFLMIEGSCIDDKLHRQLLGEAVEEIFEFDRILGKVLEFAEKDGETLVIVTADHSTGGLTILDGNLSDGLVKVNFSTKGHSGVTLPVYAYGPRADEFTGIYENSELSDKIRKIIAK